MHILRAEMRRFHRRPSFFICRNHNISSNKWRGAKPWSKQLKKCNWNEKQRHRRPQKKRTTPSSCVSLPSRGGYFYWARSRPCFWMMWSGVGCVSRGDGYDISALCEDWWGFGERAELWCVVYRSVVSHLLLLLSQTCLITGFDSAHRWAAS